MSHLPSPSTAWRHAPPRDRLAAGWLLAMGTSALAFPAAWPWLLGTGLAFAGYRGWDARSRLLQVLRGDDVGPAGRVHDRVVGSNSINALAPGNTQKRAQDSLVDAIVRSMRRGAREAYDPTGDYVVGAIPRGVGVIHIVGANQMEALTRIREACEQSDRQDDLVEIRLGRADDYGAGTGLLNPFGTGQAEDLVAMILAIDAPDDASLAVWRPHKEALLRAVIPALVWKRDRTGAPLNVPRLQQAIGVAGLQNLEEDDALPDALRERVRGYLSMIDGWSERQTQGVIDHRRHIVAPLSARLALLADQFGGTGGILRGEVHFGEAMTDRRVVAVTLPDARRHGPQDRSAVVRLMAQSLCAAARQHSTREGHGAILCAGGRSGGPVELLDLADDRTVELLVEVVGTAGDAHVSLGYVGRPGLSTWNGPTLDPANRYVPIRTPTAREMNSQTNEVAR